MHNINRYSTFFGGMFLVSDGILIKDEIEVEGIDIFLRVNKVTDFL